MLSIHTETDSARAGRLLRRADPSQAGCGDGDPPIEYVAELKFDGVAISLRYEHGLLARAATRGDGETGEDVTPNLRTIRSVPLRLATAVAPPVLEVRGEVFMRRDAFEMLNERQRATGEKVFVNRAMRPGFVRQLDATVTASRPLTFCAYGLGEVVGWPLPRRMPGARCARRLRHPGVVAARRRSWPAGLVDFHASIAAVRDALPFDIDGVVYKVNSLELQRRLGFVTRSPRGPSPTSSGAGRADPGAGIEVQVGRTGKLTPVRGSNRVCRGVTVSNATLHNEDFVRSLDVRVGDT